MQDRRVAGKDHFDVKRTFCNLKDTIETFFEKIIHGSVGDALFAKVPWIFGKCEATLLFLISAGQQRQNRLSVQYFYSKSTLVLLDLGLRRVAIPNKDIASVAASHSQLIQPRGRFLKQRKCKVY